MAMGRRRGLGEVVNLRRCDLHNSGFEFIYVSAFESRNYVF